MNKSQLSEIITNIVKRKLAEHKIGLNELENILNPTQPDSPADRALRKSQTDLANAQAEKAKGEAKLAKLRGTIEPAEHRAELNTAKANRKIGRISPRVASDAKKAAETAAKTANSTGQISTTQLSLKEVDAPSKTYKWKDGTAVPVNYQSEPIEQGWQSLGYANGWSSNPEDKQKYDQNKNKMWYTARLNTDGTQKAIYCPEAKLWYLVDSSG